MQRLGLLLLSSQRPGSRGSGMGRRRIILAAAASSGGLRSPGQGGCGGGGRVAQHRPGSLDVPPPPPPCWRQEKGREQLSGVPSPGNGDRRLRPPPRSRGRRRRFSPPLQEREVQPPSLRRLPPEPTASTVSLRSRSAEGCPVRTDDEEARPAAAAAAAARPAPRGRCPRGCSQALRGALGRGRRRLSSPSPAPGLASQRLNSQTSIMAAASERRELSAAASRRPSAYPAAVHKESRHITVRRPARPLRRPAGRAGRLRSRRGGGRREGGGRGAGGRAGGGARRGGAPAGRGGERRGACPV